MGEFSGGNSLTIHDNSMFMRFMHAKLQEAVARAFDAEWQEHQHTLYIYPCRTVFIFNVRQLAKG